MSKVESDSLLIAVTTSVSWSRDRGQYGKRQIRCVVSWWTLLPMSRWSARKIALDSPLIAVTTSASWNQDRGTVEFEKRQGKHGTNPQ